MNKEELEKEAEEYVKQNHCDFCIMADDCKSGCVDCFTVQAYLASAEPREKRIAELEEKLNNLSSVAEVRLANWQKYEKENTELKVDNAFYEKACEGATMMREQLTEAKKLLSNLLYIYQLGKNELATARVRAEAEKFLKEEEK